MGFFHCPFGCPFYDDEGCIDCGMCIATSKEEMVTASKKIRGYLISQSKQINGRVNKIAICGKGGVGKSTITVLLAKAFANQGKKVFVLDADESNPGLFRMFDLKETPHSIVSCMPRLKEKNSEPNTSWLAPEEIAIRDIPPEYFIERDGIKIMLTGKVEDPFQGCACSIGEMTRNFIDKLVLNQEIVLIDMEAGIESFGRGVERSVDVILIVIEPSFEAINLAEKINFMAQGMGINKIWSILNKVHTKELGQKMKDKLKMRRMETIGVLDYDSGISKANFDGVMPITKTAMDSANQIVMAILDRAI